jgi:hypothetical protein
LPRIAMHIDLIDDETFALVNLLTQTIKNDRYPLSPRIRMLRGILRRKRSFERFDVTAGPTYDVNRRHRLAC